MMPSKAPGQRQTRQRDAILKVLEDAPGPLTVDEVLARGQDLVQGLGIATVYRTLKLLLEAGQVQSVTLPTGETRYESSARGHHHHFQCLSCERVFDFDTCPVRLPVDRTLPGGFTVDHHEVTFYGTCPSCKG